MTLTSIVILLLPRDIITKNYEIEYDVVKKQNTLYVYFIDDNNVVGVPIETLEDNKFKLIELAFKYLTEKSNSVDAKYHSCLKLSAKLTSYEIRGDDLYLEVTSNFYDIKETDTLYALAQVLYTYKEFGFNEVFLTSDNIVIKQMADVILYDGLSELPVNLDIASTSPKTKVVKIVYYYQDKTKSFINHVINLDEDELEFTINKLIDFVNKEYNTNVKLIDFEKNKFYITVNLKCDNQDSLIIKELLMKNLNIKENNITITE
jgi:hypothetical protein